MEDSICRPASASFTPSVMLSSENGPRVDMRRDRDQQGGAAVKIDALRAVPADAQVAGSLQFLLRDAFLEERIRLVERQCQARAENAELNEAFRCAIGVLLDSALHVDLLRQQPDSARQ